RRTAIALRSFVIVGLRPGMLKLDSSHTMSVTSRVHHPVRRRQHGLARRPPRRHERTVVFRASTIARWQRTIAPRPLTTVRKRLENGRWGFKTGWTLPALQRGQ
ncbi:MAG: hypothetical protein LC808_43420, partial [Actinobacteria bacterium]|nr:hypothetical protein [Actinomycetota bacterium]